MSTTNKHREVCRMQNAETVLNVIRHWRAGCGESRTSGSEGGRRKKCSANAG